VKLQTNTVVSSPGIYQITNTVGGKRYVGSAVNLSARRRQHFGALRRQDHANIHLQAAFVKYGEEAFRFEILELCERDQVIAREQHYIDTLHPEYNMCPVAGSSMGYRHTDEARLRMSTKSKARPPAFLGHKHTEETRRKISDLKRSSGQKPTPDHMERLRQVNIGNKNTAGKKMPEGHAEKRRADMQAKWADPVWRAERLERNRVGREMRMQAA
jgi:group I intron endonuclease